MKNLFLLLSLLIVSLCSAQTGSVAGKLTDKEFNDEPLSFANVFLKGTEKGVTSDIDGLYEIADVEPGDYTLVVSYVGYETQEIPINVVADKVTNVNVGMAANTAGLGEIVITTTTRKNSEAALLLDQKKSIEIKESIGQEQIRALGISDASAATTKIVGVSKSDGAGGQIYVRGLGDRYLTTTINGLPVPSDDVERKNLNLELVPARFIENVAISKTFSPSQSADQASGNIDVVTNAISSRRTLAASVSAGINSNTADVFDDFKVTAVNDDVTAGIFSRPYSGENLDEALTGQSWNTQNADIPMNYSFGFTAGGFLDEDGKFRVYFSGGQSVDNEYREGLFREFDQAQRTDSIPDGDNRFWRRSVNTSGLLTAQYRINDDNRITANMMAVNKVFQETYEAGRDGGAIIFEELTREEAGFQFVRDQNLKNTLLLVNQLLGEHDISENNTFTWGAGYNRLAADEPNRIRNEVNILNANPSRGIEAGTLELGNTGGFQQRKTTQEILDNEFAGTLRDKIILSETEEGDVKYEIAFGGDARNKQRDFRSQFLGLDEVSTGSVNPESIDNLSAVFTQTNIDNGLLRIIEQAPDTYDARLTSYAGFVDFLAVFGELTAEVGLRYQNDNIDLNYDVGQAPGGREGEVEKNYERFYPSFNLKYDLNEKSALRLSGSLSQTLPEFKEIAPFTYLNPIGFATAGNLRLEASKNYNLDIKYELFPQDEELISVTGFYKRIEDPINKTLRLGGEDIFSFFNTGSEARVVGIEVEARKFIIKSSDSLPTLKVSGNVSYLNHVQDLKTFDEGVGFNGQARTFRYRGIDEIGLEGASDWTSNLALTFNTNTVTPLQLTLAANYASDRLFSLGAPRNQDNPDEFFNGEILETGVVKLDFIFSQELSENLTIGGAVRNILNPTIERYQFVSSDPDGSTDFTEETILSYSRGVVANLSLNYTF